MLYIIRDPAECGLEASDAVECGSASLPVTYMSQDSLWMAMLYVMRTPAKGGLGTSDIVECGLAPSLPLTWARTPCGRPCSTSCAIRPSAASGPPAP